MAAVVLERLRRTWYGSALALVGLVILTVVPVARHCAGISAARGSPGGVVCWWTPPLQSPGEPGLILLLVFVSAIVIVPLAFPHRIVLLVTGVATVATVAGLIVVTLSSFDISFALERLGLALRGDAESGLLAFLPSGAAWIIASFRPPASVAATS